MFPEPQMDYKLRPSVDDAPSAGVPLAFFVGLLAGIMLAGLAVMVGLVLAIS
jgi:hypothetical protein